MLNKRSQIYEIQKRVTGGQHQQSRGSNKPDNKMASAASVHSDSFNYSTSTGATSKKPSSNSRQTESHNQAVRKSKQPRMGVPMMTSTPRGQMKSSSSSVEEPIYCEIPSPTKGRTNYPPPLPSRQQNGLRSSWRPKTDAEVVTSSEKQRLPKTNVGLGRRAITQLDMSVAATNRGRPLVTSGRPWQQQPLWKEAIKIEPPNAFRNGSVTTSEAISNLYGGQVEVTAQNPLPFPPPLTTNNSTTLMKGVLWQQREKRFSRWKERFFVISNDYLQCYRKGTSKISEMGGFIYRIRLSEIEQVELIERRGYLTLRLSLPKEGGKLLLRKTDGIRKWFLTLQECVENAKKRRISMKSTEEFWTKRQHTDSSAMEGWILARHNGVLGGQQYCWSDTGSCVSETASTTILPNHLKSVESASQKRSLETASTIVPGRKSYNNLKTTHYGLIDWPSASDSSGLKSPTALMNRKNNSHDSGVDSMNTNSSGSMMSSSANSRLKSPLMELDKFSRQRISPTEKLLRRNTPLSESEKFVRQKSSLIDPDKFSRQITLV